MALKHFKLGKKPARRTARRLWLRNYLDASRLKVDSAPPRDFGALAKVQNPEVWTDVLGNARYGCCMWSAAFRRAMVAMASVGQLPAMTIEEATATVLDAYSGCTGFDPADPRTDQGTDALRAMHYLQQTGLVMPDGTIHKIGSYAWVNPQDFDTLLMAFNLFDGLVIGVQFPGSWEQADIWTIVPDPIEGGHAIVADSDVSIQPEGLRINTWGRERILTRAAIAQYADEIAVVISPDMLDLSSGKSIAGFDAEQLLADEQTLAQA